MFLGHFGTFWDILGLVWSGLVWSGLVWTGLVCSGLVWSLASELAPAPEPTSWPS